MKNHITTQIDSMKGHGEIENVHYYDIYPFTYAPNKERNMYNCKSERTSGYVNILLQWSSCLFFSIQFPMFPGPLMSTMLK